MIKSMAPEVVGLRKRMIRGILKAWKSHRKMSSAPFARAPEYLVTVKIAEELSTAGAGKVELEYSVKKALTHGKARKKGKTPLALRNDGRFDILLHWTGEKPRAIIEVKHPVRKATVLNADIRRICISLKKTGLEIEDKKVLRRGFIAFFLVAPMNSKKKSKPKIFLREQRKNIQKYANAIAAKHNCVAKLALGTPITDICAEGTRWGEACCIVLRRAKSD